MDQKKKVRLSDIAKELNISTVTVSKALSNKEGVGDDLRKEIKALALKMGYQTKKNLSADQESITGNIGILIPSRFFTQNYSFYWYLFNFLSSELLHRNYYSIMELLSDEDEKSLEIPKIIKNKKVDGLIILGQTSQDYIDTIYTHFDNFILMDFYSPMNCYDSVSNDDYYCSYILTKYVIEQGHKKLRFVGNFEATTSISDRYMGYKKALIENNISDNEKNIIKDRDEKGGKIKIELPLDDMPSAFICNCDETAATLIDELTEKGFKVPEDISVTGFDNYLTPKRLNFGLTTMYIRPEDTTCMAADLIISKITGQPYIKGRHLVSGNIIIRDSVKSI